MGRKKVTVVGAGHVGATTGLAIANKGLADIVLTDIIERMPQGKALDMMEATPLMGRDAEIIGTNNYVDTQGSDIVVITAGLARKPGMSRDDLLFKNAEIIGGVVDEVTKHSPNSIIIMVTNPLDVMAYLAYKKSGFPRERVIGMAGVLDSARFRTFIAMELGVSVDNTHAFVLGGHGDSMVPLPRYSTVAGVPITELMSEEQVNRIVQRTRDGGAEIVSLLGTGSAYFAPAWSVAQMVEAILLDRKEILPCAAFLQGEYGVENAYVGVPVQLGAGGMEKVFEIDLSDDERTAFEDSVAEVKDSIAKLDL
ncbi:MAG: malate dehydrogenase [Acidobacteriota bacterium]|jgi:malate dehydrogenase|nr:malate dehydrogenase [Acidobacteriota bacterium]MDP6687363.1 malate dehydrogenase [Acidobacteriota bacterium]MEC8944078.1 malate dehydrogenase [Acidobacteriota bacterium]MEE3274467.1 malate dehydrogenase [Acidobacteriota bacterium]|tara:strand:+ start:4892 stop:5821 length:930 start_codon:yes stop_codon:yes gene_type:complete